MWQGIVIFTSNFCRLHVTRNCHLYLKLLSTTCDQELSSLPQTSVDYMWPGIVIFSPNFCQIIWGRCNLKSSRRTVIVLPVYTISSLKITPPKTPNSGQFSYPLPTIVSFLFEKNRLELRFRSRDFFLNLFPVWQPYCWRFWSAIVPIHTFTINAHFGSVLSTL